MAEAVAGSRLRARATTASRRPAAATIPSVLWSGEDLLRWGITIGLGGIVIAVSWYIGAGDLTFSQQVGPIDAALGGLLLAGVGNLAWLVHGRRALGERRRALLPDVAEAVAQPSPRARADDTLQLPVAGTTTVRLFVAGESMERFHRPGCALAEGRSGWVSMTRHEHEAAGRRPCGVCRP